MEEMYGVPSSTTADYAGKQLLTPENLIFPPDYHSFLMSSSSSSARIPMYGSDDILSAAEPSSAGIQQQQREQHQNEVHTSTVMKAKIASHPHYPRLLQAYIDFQKVGASPEIAVLLEEIQQENDLCCKKDLVSTCYGSDPELDHFMENYCNMLVKYKSDFARPFDEATSFLNNMENQLSHLCTGGANSVPTLLNSDDGGESSEEDFSIGEGNNVQLGSEDRELKDRLLRKFGSHIGTLKLEFSKKKKKGKLPKEAKQTLLQWWKLHYKWPYPTEADKIELANTTGLDQKQINNWFINQRKRHWKPSENMHFSMMQTN